MTEVISVSDEFSPSNLNRYYDLIKQAMRRDRFWLSRQLKSIKARADENQPIDKLWSKWLGRLTRSIELLEKRKSNRPKVEFSEQLPIAQRWEEIAEAINKHPVVILAGETGSGKTTQLPKICLELGRGTEGLIGHTQPRRIAARTVASRIAEELSTELGAGVGYQVRFTDHSSDESYIKLMTDGILLAEIQNDRYLSRYDTLIIDEAHERSLNIDFLLGYIKQILPKRPDLKVIITSATIDLERFSKHFNNAPIIEVSGRTYPVELEYRPPIDSDDDLTTSIVNTVYEIIDTEKRASERPKGDILVFLSGEREIRETALALRRAELPHWEVLPLYARLSLAEQNKVFGGHRGRRIVLATNVAETSITVPGIRYVIDPGYARISRYSYKSKIQRLPVEAVSQASANQRKGRCGRVSDGICYRLYDEQDFVNRPEFTDPEILRTNLASVILQMLNLQIGDIRKFPFVDCPDQRMINDGFKLLEELQAVTSSGKLTKMGRQLMTLPVDPKFGRMLLAASENRCLEEVLIIVSGLSVQDPRERPADKQQAADQKHARFKDKESDFIAYINLWKYAEEQRQELSQNQFRKQCKREFLSFLRLREWREIHHQLRLACSKLDLLSTDSEAGYDAIHKSLLSGLLGNVGNIGEEREFLGARNRRFHVFPGSALNKKPPKWLVSAQLLETSRLFAHTCAKIDPDWLIKIASHKLKRQQYEPFYHIKSGQVMALEKVSLYGLVIADKQRVSYGKIDPVLSRKLFIREALVEGGYRGKGDFYKANQSLVAELQDLEAKSRRRDIVVEDEVIFEFYNERVESGIFNLVAFEKWREKAETDNSQLLYLDRERLMRHSADSVTEAQFPDQLSWQGLEFPIHYHFEPGHPEDGVNLSVPVMALHLVPKHRLEWAVPGVLRDKCIALVKGLPKQWRKHFVPVPDYVDKAIAAMKADDTPLADALSFQLKRQTSLEIPPELWGDIAIDDFYRVNIQVVDDTGKVLAQGRDLDTLRAQYKNVVRQTSVEQGNSIEQQGITSWQFGELPETIELSRAGMKITAYPSLVDCDKSVSIELKDHPLEAQTLSCRGVCRLALMEKSALTNPMIKKLLKGNDLALSVVTLGKREQVAEDIILGALHQLCFRATLPRSREAFIHQIESHWPQIEQRVGELERLLLEILKTIVAIKKSIKSSKNALAIAVGAHDIQAQLSHLVYPGFIYATPYEWLCHFPRYLKAIQLRLEKMPSQIQKDKVWTAELEGFWDKYSDYREKKGELIADANAQLSEYRWMLEEYRVSLFAQTLKTAVPVSSKRINKLWSEIGL